MTVPIIYYCPLNPTQEPNPFMAGLWLNHRGYPITYLGEGPADAQKCETPLGLLRVKLIPRASGRLARCWWHVRAALALLQFRFQLRGQVIVYLQRHESTLAAFFGLLFFPRRRLIFHTQDYLEPGRHPIWAFFEKRIARRAAWVISNEPNRARFMASHYRLKQMPVIVRTGLPKDWPVPERDESLRHDLLARAGLADREGARLIMAGGGYSRVRCTEQLIQAVGRLDDRYLLVFTGMKPDTPPYTATLDACRRAGIERRVVILPYLEYEDLLRHMAACDVGILLYPNDGVGNFYQAPGRLAEYLNCGLPVVASNFPGLELLVLKHRLGQVCDPEAPEQIAAAIDRLGALGEAELAANRHRLRELGRTEFAYETQADRLEEILRQAAGEKG
jgi:glycosyltransferase involved in cell wall biosynthesis